MFDTVKVIRPRCKTGCHDGVAPAGEVAIAGLIGSSAPMTSLRHRLVRVARSVHDVLVTGPTGAGKELVARALHDHSIRAREPFVEINCSAIPEQLIESQLFGHERGAFTGADRRQEGHLSAVRGGTLFLDEVAELPLTQQAKLLRVLETRRFRPLGALLEQGFAGRIVAATHANLHEQIRRRQFREDLFYRLNVLTLEVPSLDERRDDIPQLVEHFAARQSRLLRFSVDAMQWLMQTSWPGNVRELKHLVDRVAVFCDDQIVTATTLRQVGVGSPSERRESENSLRDLARSILHCSAGDKIRAIVDALVDEAMAACGDNKTAAAKLLGVHRKVVERLWFARNRGSDGGDPHADS